MHVVDCYTRECLAIEPRRRQYGRGQRICRPIDVGQRLTGQEVVDSLMKRVQGQQLGLPPNDWYGGRWHVA